MLHAGLDLSRKSLEVHLLAEDGATVGAMSVPPDVLGLRGLVRMVGRQPGGRHVVAVIESMNGARFVHDTLELAGWQVEIADAAKVKGLAPLACKTDRIDAWVLAELSRRDLIPSIWLPDPATRGARELARWRLHLVRHRTALKNRVHAALVAFGHPCPVADLFGIEGRDLLDRLQFPEPWRGDVESAIRLIDTLSFEIATLEDELKAEGVDHPYVRLLLTVPGISWVLAYTVAAEIGDIARFPTPVKLCGYTGLCPRVYQSGQSDHRGSLAKNGPKYLRWALIEAATKASRHPVYAERYQRTAKRLGRQRGKKVARVDLARRLAEAIWHMLVNGEAFAPAGFPASKAA